MLAPLSIGAVKDFTIEPIMVGGRVVDFNVHPINHTPHQDANHLGSAHARFHGGGVTQ